MFGRMLLVSALALAGMVFATKAEAAQCAHPHDLQTGMKCTFCNGTGWQGNFQCSLCKGTGRNNSY